MKNKIEIKYELGTGKSGKQELDIHNDNKFIESLGTNALGLHILSIAIFEVEKIIVHNQKVKKFILPTPLDLSKKEKLELSNLLNQLFLFLYKKDISFTFEKIELENKAEISSKDKENNCVLLFSGGLDSTIGINYCKSKFDSPLLVYLRHGNAGQLTPIINKIEEKIIKPNNLKLIRIAGPKQESGYFANTRGLLYFLTGSLFASINSSPLVIAECGVTMYQPRFGPLYEVTYTTHPVIITLGKEITRIIMKRALDVQLPFEDNTKAEMVKAYGDEQSISNSFSCLRNLRFASTKGNCGKCYACLVRRLGIIATRDDPTGYSEQKDLASVKEIKEKLYPIVDFCYRVITDFDGLEYWQKERILKYGKKDLFRRFSLDTFVALDKLSKKQKLPEWISPFLRGIDSVLINDRAKRLAPE